jgi:hypothetical protein
MQAEQIVHVVNMSPRQHRLKQDGLVYLLRPGTPEKPSVLGIRRVIALHWFGDPELKADHDPMKWTREVRRVSGRDARAWKDMEDGLLWVHEFARDYGKGKAHYTKQNEETNFDFESQEMSAESLGDVVSFDEGVSRVIAAEIAQRAAGDIAEDRAESMIAPSLGTLAPPRPTAGKR